MSIITAPYLNASLFPTDFFQLDVIHKEKATKINMKMLTNYFTTENIPATHSILKSSLPSILRSKCFNENNYSFSKEVKNTEIGHLFEHIILEYLSQAKFSSGDKNPIYNGLTRWNWNKDERGTFHIEIDAGLNEKMEFNLALSKSIKLLNIILASISDDISIYKTQFIPNYLHLNNDNKYLDKINR